jgi:hypothetical protein
MDGPRLIPQVIPWRREDRTSCIDCTTTKSTACPVLIVRLMYLMWIIGVPRSKHGHVTSRLCFYSLPASKLGQCVPL